MAQIDMDKQELLRRYSDGERDFSNIRMRDADMGVVDLSRASFRGAYLERFRCHDRQMERIPPSHSNLCGADFSNAMLYQASFSDAILTSAKFRHADCRETAFNDCDLVEADFSHATLTDASLIRVKANDAMFGGTNLARANLSGGDFSAAEFGEATFFKTITRTGNRWASFKDALVGNTAFCDVDLTTFCLASLQHRGPCAVDALAVLASFNAPEIERFLARAGVPDLFTTFMLSSARAMGDAVHSLLRSTFISYGGPDADFARTLYRRLAVAGVRVQFFEKDAVPGESLALYMRRAIEENERIAFICSRDSLDRDGVVNELTLALEKEAKSRGARIIIPIALDSYVYDDWKPEDPTMKEALTRRVVADFRDSSAFDQQFLQVLAALKRESP